MKICSNCGKENSDNNKFCMSCGTDISQQPVLTQPPAAPQMQGQPPVPPQRPQMQGRPPVPPQGAQMQGQPPVPPQKAQMQGRPPVPPQRAQMQGRPPVPPQRPQMQGRPPVPPQGAGKNKSYIGLIIAIVAIVVVLFLGGVGFGAWYCYDNGLLFFAAKDYDNESGDTNSDDKDTKSTDDKESKSNSKTNADDKTEEPSASPTAAAQSKKVFVPGKYIKLSAQVSASSEKAGGANSPSKLTDGDADTAWVEGVTGTGIGQSVTYKLSGKQVVCGVAIMPGCMTGLNQFNNNAAPSEIRVKAGKEEVTLSISNVYPNFDDVKNSFKYLDLPKPVEADEVVITISNVRAGAQTDETYISEMYVYTLAEKGKESQYDAASWNTKHVQGAGEYVLPESNTRYLTEADLTGLTAEQCRIARNEIYARYGRMFDDANLQAYFNNCSWYHGSIPADQFNDNVLNEFEKANRDLIVQFEQKQGYR